MALHIHFLIKRIVNLEIDPQTTRKILFLPPGQFAPTVSSEESSPFASASLAEEAAVRLTPGI